MSEQDTGGGEEHADEEVKAYQEQQQKMNESDPDNTPLTLPKDHKDGEDYAEKIGPGVDRKCRDVICLLLMIAAWIAMTGVGFVVCGVVEDTRLQPGDPARLINAIDFAGNICGVDDKTCGTGSSSDLNDFGNIDTREDDCKSINTDSSTITKLKTLEASKGYYLPSGSSVCIKSCPSKDDYTKFICEYDIQSYIDSLGVGSSQYIVKGWYYTAKYLCMPQVATVEYVGYCAPVEAMSAVSAAAAEADADAVDLDNVGKDDKTMFQKWQADMYNSLGVIGGVGVGVTVVVGFIFLYIMRIPGVLSSIIWGIILGIFLCFFLPAVLLIGYTYPEWSPEENDESVHTKTEADAVLYIGYFFAVVAGLFLCFIICMRSRINLAISITKEACKAFAKMPILILFPVVQAVGMAIFLIPWTIYMLYLASSGELVLYKITSSTGQELTYRDWEYSENTQLAGLYMLFTFFWTSQFIVAIGQLVIAMAVSMWYFTRDKSKIGNMTVWKAVKTSFRYHMGSAAFGALIIAIIKTIRAILNYLKKKALAATKNKKDTASCTNPANIIKRLLQNATLMFICCVDCCMWCVEKCMKFINKNAYIQIAIFGYGFCKAARKAFFLILRNLLRIAAVGMVSEIVTMIGKLFIPGVTLLIAYLALMEMQLYSFWFPLLLTFFVSWMVTDVFMEIFSMAISTILQCFCADEELFSKDGKQPFAEGGLRSAIKVTNKGSKDAKHGCHCLPCCGSSGGNSVAPVESGSAPPAQSTVIQEPGEPLP